MVACLSGVFGIESTMYTVIRRVMTILPIYREKVFGIVYEDFGILTLAGYLVSVSLKKDTPYNDFEMTLFLFF